jgi:FkbM family methyltransferase
MSMKKYFGWLRSMTIFRQAKLIVKRLQGRELRLKPELEVPLISLGFGEFCPDGLGDSSIVYSLGVGEQIAFDLAFMERFGADIFAFDPTPISVDMIQKLSPPKSFKFYPWAVTGQDKNIKLYPRIRQDGKNVSEFQYTIIAEEGSQNQAVDVQGFTMKTIMNKLEHDSIDLLRINIEGAEYEVFDSMLDSGIYPKQIIVEFHHRFPNIGIAKTEKMLIRFRESGYKIISVSIAGCIMTLLRVSE